MLTVLLTLKACGCQSDVIEERTLVVQHKLVYPNHSREYLFGHQIPTVVELGWSALSNGEPLKRAEATFDLLITTDQQMRYQQNLAGRKLSIDVLMTTSWPRLEADESHVVASITAMQPGEYRKSA